MSVKIDPNKKDVIKKYFITKEEKERFQTLLNAINIINVELEGAKQLLMFHSFGVRQRLNIEDKAPEGYARDVNFDMELSAYIVTDRPVLQENTENIKNEEKIEKTERIVN